MGDDCLGIVIEDSLQDSTALQRLTVLARRLYGAWDFVLVRVPAGELRQQVQHLQQNMVTDDTWYCHFFRADELLVVFRDATFAIATDPASWTPAIAHGLARGVSRDQLDFHPRTRDDAEAFFRVP